MAKVGRRQAQDTRRRRVEVPGQAPGRERGLPVNLPGAEPAQDRHLSSGVLRPELWTWPLLGALVLGPLKAGQLGDPLPICAVNGLIGLSLLLWAWRPGFVSGERSPSPLAKPTSALVHPTFWLALFLMLNLLSLAVSVYRHATLSALLDLAAWFGAYWLVTRGGRAVVPWVLGALLLAGGVAAAQALQEYAVHVWSKNDPGWRAFGPFFNPNLLAATCILLAPLCLGLMMRARHVLPRVAAAAGALLFVAALLTSGSRGGALGLLVSAPAFLAIAAARRLRPDGRQLLAAMGMLMALVPVVWSLRVPMMGRLAGIQGTPAVAAGSPAAGASDRSNAFRVETWKATCRMIAARPLLGTGAGTFEHALPRYTLVGYTQRAHQSYLQTAAEAGVFALVAWLVALAIVLARLVFSSGGRSDWLLPGIGAGLVAGMAHNVVDYSWSVSGTALPFWAFMGAAVARTQTHAHGQSTVRRPDRLPHLRAAVALAGLVLLGLSIVWLQAAERRAQAQAAMAVSDARGAVEQFGAAVAFTPMDASLRIEQARALTATGDLNDAETSLKRATQLAPTWGRPYHVLGRLLERQGRLKEAEDAFRAAAERDPRNTQPLEALAVVREANGDHSGALEAWRRIIAIAEHPNSRIYALDGMTDPIPGLAYEAVGREAEQQRDVTEAMRLYRRGAERLRDWRRQRPYRNQLREARGEGPSERDPEYQRAEIRLWERLAELYSSRGMPREAAEARKELQVARGAESVTSGG
jgi:O-antigen ligase/tetratricopeptide (TPR) repeat protein